MSLEQSAAVMEYRVGRLAGAPRRMTYWVAFFTLINGIMLLTQRDMIFLVGFAAPYSSNGATAHFAIAAVTAALALISTRASWVLLVPLAAYVADTGFAGYLELWGGVALHVVVLGFVALAIVARRNLRSQTQTEKEHVV